jgi:iron(III) transport system permease protein
MMILIMVNVAHFMSSPYLMMYNSFGKMNENLEAVGQTLGVGRLRMIRDVFLPQSLGTVAEMFSYLFVNCMMTISAVSFLANVDTKPISLMIPQFENQRQYECAAVVSLMILAVNILMKVAVSLIKNFLARKERNVKHYEAEQNAI